MKVSEIGLIEGNIRPITDPNELNRTFLSLYRSVHLDHIQDINWIRRTPASEEKDEAHRSGEEALSDFVRGYASARTGLYPLKYCEDRSMADKLMRQAIVDIKIISDNETASRVVRGVCRVVDGTIREQLLLKEKGGGGPNSQSQSRLR